MIKENNGWFCTDPECMQYCKKINEEVFRFIQAVWLDTCGDDTKAENAKDDSDNYAVCANVIDLDPELYDEGDFEDYISSYGYNSIAFLRKEYGDDADQILAECIFETECLYDHSSIAGVVSWDDAEQIIQKYIDENC